MNQMYSKIKIEFTGGGLWEHIATHPDGRTRTARGNFFECVGDNGYLTFDEEFAKRHHAEMFKEEKEKENEKN